jgi:hypothetical protein
MLNGTETEDTPIDRVDSDALNTLVKLISNRAQDKGLRDKCVEVEALWRST